MLTLCWMSPGSAEPDRELPPFGVLNVESSIPSGLPQILLDQALHHPEQNLVKLDILVTASDSEDATLSLNIHRGAPHWNEAQIGLDGTAMEYGEIAIIKARRVDPFPENDWAQRKLNGALSRRRAMGRTLSAFRATTRLGYEIVSCNCANDSFPDC